MSQKPQYFCDECQKPIGDKPHLSLVFSVGGACGIALPPGTRKGQQGWLVARQMQHTSNFKHFHNGKCLGAWADSEIKKALHPTTK